MVIEYEQASADERLMILDAADDFVLEQLKEIRRIEARQCDRDYDSSNTEHDKTLVILKMTLVLHVAGDCARLRRSGMCEFRYNRIIRHMHNIR